mmetsp:Transcript_44718/g.139107  ORF Transcript_44718/g.139107 Transcript_44718/m.139107 type:complete len:229 (+) Transcript_44718:242-928(+)
MEPQQAGDRRETSAGAGVHRCGAHVLRLLFGRVGHSILGLPQEDIVLLGRMVRVRFHVGRPHGLRDLGAPADRRHCRQRGQRGRSVPAQQLQAAAAAAADAHGQDHALLPGARDAHPEHRGRDAGRLLHPPLPRHRRLRLRHRLHEPAGRARARGRGRRGALRPGDVRGHRLLHDDALHQRRPRRQPRADAHGHQGRQPSADVVVCALHAHFRGDAAEHAHWRSLSSH